VVPVVAVSRPVRHPHGNGLNKADAGREVKLLDPR
jgi:hypothetical protein